MAYPIPTTVPLIPGYQLVQPPAGKEPLHSILAATNRLYQRYSPALLSLAPIHGSGASPTHVWEVPLPVSADGLEYTVECRTWRSATGGNVTLDIDTSTTVTTGSPWSAGINVNHSHSSNHEDWTTTITPPLGTKFVKISIDGNSADCQLQWIGIYPTMPQTLPATAQASGFIPYEDSHLSASGGPVHTELINRAWNNVRSILMDRRQCASSFAQPTNYGAPHRVGVGLGGGAHAVTQICNGPLWIPFQSNPLVRVRAKANLSGGAVPGTIRVRSGTGIQELDADGGDQEAIMPYTGNNVTATIITPPERVVDLIYLTLDYVPGDTA